MEQQTITPENPGETVSRRVERLSGRPLSWATAIAVGARDIKSTDKRITAEYMGVLNSGCWDPVNDWDQCGHILDQFGVEFANTQPHPFPVLLPDEPVRVWARTMESITSAGVHCHAIQLESGWYAGANRRLAACREVVAKAYPMGDILIPTRLLYE